MLCGPMWSVSPSVIVDASGGKKKKKNNSCSHNYSRGAQLSVARSHRQLTFTWWNIIFLGPQNGI